MMAERGSIQQEVARCGRARIPHKWNRAARVTNNLLIIYS